MESLTIERVIAAPPDKVFASLSKADNYSRSPLVFRVRLVQPGAGADYGLGAVRSALTFGWFLERITAYDPPHSFDYLVIRSFPPIRHEGGRLSFTGVDGGTRVVWTTAAELRLPFSAFVTRHMVMPLLSRVFASILTAVEADLASGR